MFFKWNYLNLFYVNIHTLAGITGNKKELFIKNMFNGNYFFIEF